MIVRLEYGIAYISYNGSKNNDKPIQDIVPQDMLPPVPFKYFLDRILMAALSEKVSAETALRLSREANTEKMEIYFPVACWRG